MTDPGIREAMVTLEKLSQDEKTRRAARAREEAARMRRHEMAEERREGHKEGREEGREEGRQMGESDALTRIISKRFGPIPNEIRTAIKQASLEQIHTWIERCLDASSLEDVFS